MIRRLTMFVLAIAAAMALAACGGSDDAEAEDSSSSAEDTSDTTAEAPATTAPADDSAESESDENAGNEAAESDDGCAQVVMAAEIDAIFGTSVEITGSGERCTLRFADDSIGGLAAFSGSKADEAIEALLAGNEQDEAAGVGGVLLPDGRGYVATDSVAVRGDSGRVFSVGIPDNIEVADRLAAMQALANLLLTR